jgi:hypothetical protein
VWGWTIFGGTLVCVCLLLAFLLGERLDGVARVATGALLRLSPRAFAALASGVALLLAAAMSRHAFAGQPYTGDEMAQQWHARILLAGRLSAVAEPWPEFFNTAVGGSPSIRSGGPPSSPSACGSERSGS